MRGYIRFKLTKRQTCSRNCTDIDTLVGTHSQVRTQGEGVKAHLSSTQKVKKYFPKFVIENYKKGQKSHI